MITKKRGKTKRGRETVRFPSPSGAALLFSLRSLGGPSGAEFQGQGSQKEVRHGQKGLMEPETADKGDRAL